MTQRYVLFLIGWLMGIHFTPASANTPQQHQQQRIRKNLPTKRQKNATLPSKVTPKRIGKASKNSSVRRPSKPTPITVQDGIKHPCKVATAMAMQRAWIYSALLPGAGQLYNKHYWKVAVIYAGFVGFVGGAIYYHREYFKYKTELRQLQQQNMWNKSLENYVEECRAGRDLCVIFTVFWHIINIFDAYVGASLKTFTLSDDISMEVRPIMSAPTHNPPTIGLSLALSFQNENTLDRLWKNGESY
mmetsp:Transcript_9878/g.22801  ORF Transcript_9878/g.22801 Transcript_9878/m.22801 type:complete len:245 (-) Transcript_9878:1179-1913(-)